MLFEKYEKKIKSFYYEIVISKIYMLEKYKRE